MGNEKSLSISEQMEIIHANAAEAMSRLPDRNEFCRFYTVCAIDAEAQTDESYSLTLIFSAEACKDMGTEDPSDDVYVTLHDESTCTEFCVADFKAEIQNLIEMYGEKHIMPIIPEEYLRYYGLPDDYQLEHLYELLDTVIENDNWSLGGGFGVCIVDYTD